MSMKCLFVGWLLCACMCAWVRERDRNVVQAVINVFFTSSKMFKEHFRNPPLHLLSILFWSLFADSTASIVVLRKGFSRLTQDIYHLPIEINDNGFPAMSSTNTLTIRVCSCDSKSTILSCNVESYILQAGLSTGALIAILACIVILLGKELIFGKFSLIELYLSFVKSQMSHLNGCHKHLEVSDHRQHLYWAEVCAETAAALCFIFMALLVLYLVVSQLEYTLYDICW